jgi:phosphoribosylamine---glycine ligase
VRVLVIGAGGREHALCWALRRENPDAELYCAPGNPGTATVAHNLSIAGDDLDRVADAADMYAIDLTVIGPELSLARGLADRLRAEGKAVVGPSAAAARLESSKAFAKQVMADAGVRTADSETFTDPALALTFVDRHPEPLVVKASGLAAGKGAVVCTTRREAALAVRSMLEAGDLGEAGRTIVIEAYLGGEEISVLALTDGQELELLPISQDHKRLLPADQGPNTGGMGAYSPVSIANPAVLERVRRDVLHPTLEAMRRLGTPFSGVLYAGLMIDAAGVPSVVEFNCRLGDPEAQVVLPLVSGGLTDCFSAIARGERPSRLETSRAAAVTTVLASRGYPDAPEKGARIELPGTLPQGVTVFHAGTALEPDGTLRVNGGRVLTVTGVGATFSEAQRLSREAADAVDFDGKIYRPDIGWREAARLEARQPVTARGA